MYVNLWGFEIGQRPYRLQKCRELTDDGRQVDRDLEVDYGYVVDHKQHRAWFLDQQALQRKKGDVTSVLVIDERSAVPHYLGNGINREKKAKQYWDHLTKIAEQSLEAQLTVTQEQQNKDKTQEVHRIIIYVLGLTVVILAIVAVLPNVDCSSVPFIGG